MTLARCSPVFGDTVLVSPGMQVRAVLTGATWATRFVPKIGQIGIKRDKSGTFSDQISVHFGAQRQNVLKSDLKKSRICPIWGHSDPFWVQIYSPSCQGES